MRCILSSVENLYSSNWQQLNTCALVGSTVVGGIWGVYVGIQKTNFDNRQLKLCDANNYGIKCLKMIYRSIIGGIGGLCLGLSLFLVSDFILFKCQMYFTVPFICTYYVLKWNVVV